MSHLRTGLPQAGADTRTQAIAVIDRLGLLDSGTCPLYDDPGTVLKSTAPTLDSQVARPKTHGELIPMVDIA
jgi:hypothetical protein